MNDQLPETLYHYTTGKGLLGIANSKKLWATSIRQMNDAAEFTYAFGVLRRAMGEAAKNRTSDVVAIVKLLEGDLDSTKLEMKSAFTDVRHLRFVVSFSKWGDQLSQWRAYCSDGGYSLGFGRKTLEEIGIAQGFEFVRCSYDLEQHKSEAKLLAMQVVSMILEIPEAIRGKMLSVGNYTPRNVLAHVYPVQKYMLDELDKLAPLWNHYSFKEEAEWRLVSREPQDVSFRAGRAVIVPYTEIELDHPSAYLNDQLCVLDEAYIGPSEEPDVSAASVKQLLDAKRIACPQITGSAVPLRPNWGS